MATAKLKGRVELDTGPFQRGLARMKIGAAKFGAQAGQAFKRASSELMNAAKTVVAAAGVLAGIGIRRNLQIEQLQLQFEGLLGSADAAKDRMRELSDFAASTPFAIGDLAEVNKMLEAVGKGGMDTLTMIGDASAQTGTDMKELAKIMQKAFVITSSGGALGDVINQLAERGLLATDAIKKLKAESAKGFSNIGSMELIISELKRAEGAMKRLSESGVGRLSTLKDVSLDALGEITAGMANASSDGVQVLIDKINELRNSGAFRQWGAEITATIKGVVNGWKSLDDGQREALINMAKVSAAFVVAYRLGFVQELIKLTAFLVSRMITMLSPAVLFGGLLAAGSFIAGLTIGKALEAQFDLSGIMLKLVAFRDFAIDVFGSLAAQIAKTFMTIERAKMAALSGDMAGAKALLAGLPESFRAMKDQTDAAVDAMIAKFDEIDELSTKKRGAFSMDEFRRNLVAAIADTKGDIDAFEGKARALFDKLAGATGIGAAGDAFGSFMEAFRKAKDEAKQGIANDPFAGVKNGALEGVQAIDGLKQAMSGEIFRGGKIADIGVGAQTAGMGGGPMMGGVGKLLAQFQNGVRNGQAIGGRVPNVGAAAGAARLRQDFNRKQIKEQTDAQRMAVEELRKLNAGKITIGAWT